LIRFFYERATVACERKEKQEYKIGKNLSQEKRKKEKMRARREKLIELKDNRRDNNN